MCPYVEIGGRQVPVYGLIIMIGVGLAAWYLLRPGEEKEDEPEMLILFGLIGSVIGGKVLYLLTQLPSLIRDLPYLFTQTAAFLDRYLFAGFVFYGGMYGLLVVLLLRTRKKKRFYHTIQRNFAVYPLIHAFGRIGCFCMGCCYGKEAPWGIAFENSQIAPNGVPLVPVQLIEAAGNLLLFGLLAYQSHRKTGGRRMLGTYLSSYAVMRFVIEFFRGDDYRGFILGLSTSQLISIPTLGLGLWLLLGKGANKEQTIVSEENEKNGECL